MFRVITTVGTSIINYGSEEVGRGIDGYRGISGDDLKALDKLTPGKCLTKMGE